VTDQPALRQASLGEILDLAFGLYRHRFKDLLLIAIVCTAPPLALNVYLSMAGGMAANLVLTLVYLLIYIVFSSVATASTVFVVSESYLGRPLPATRALGRATSYIGRLFVLGMLTSVAVGLGLLLLIVPGVILLSGLVLATPVLVLENSENALAAMGRAWALSRGFKGKIFLLLLTMLAIIYIPAAALGAIAGVATGFTGGALAVERGPAGAAVVVLTVAGGLVQMLVYPMFYCALTVAYYDLRVRKEGFDLEILADALGTH